MNKLFTFRSAVHMVWGTRSSIARASSEERHSCSRRSQAWPSGHAPSAPKTNRANGSMVSTFVARGRGRGEKSCNFYAFRLIDFWVISSVYSIQLFDLDPYCIWDLYIHCHIKEFGLHHHRGLSQGQAAKKFAFQKLLTCISGTDVRTLQYM